MMKKLLLLTALVLTITAQAALQNDTLVVRIKGMRCEECAHKVNTVLRQLDGVGTVDYNLERRTATIAYNRQLTCPDSIQARLERTGRYKASPYSPADVIRRGMGLQMSDMHCQRCADRIMKRLQQVTGVDSIAPHVDKHYVFVRYDANRTSKDVIRHALVALGFTPVNYYTSKDISFAYFTLTASTLQGNTPDAIIDTALTLDGVDDANVNPKQHSLAITYVNKETSSQQLLEQLQAEGIEASLPPAHECQEN
jgi:copper ion binding protein